MSERFFECETCKAVVQGWNAAHWYHRWHKDGCNNPVIREIEKEDENPAKEEA